MLKTAIATLFALCALTACLPTATGTGSSGDCSDTVTIGTGLTPEITWPDNTAMGLSVYTTADTATRLWTLSSAGTPFSGPVTYGTVPSGALEAEGAAEALVTGTEYGVTITLGDGNNCDEGTFTP